MTKLFLPALAAVFLFTGQPAQAAQHDLSRIVSIGGSVTELLYALGLQDKIVAVDTTSVYPEKALKEKASVGYMRRLSPEGVMSVKPSVIIAIEGSGPPATLDVLRQGQIKIITIADDTSAKGALAKVEQIAKLVDREDRGKEIIQNMHANFSDLERALGPIEKKLRVLFLLNGSMDRMIAGGVETSAEAIIKLAGAKNAITDFKGYKQISVESLAVLQPDAILIMTRDDKAVDRDALLKNPMIAATPAGRERRIITMRGQFLLGFGPRVGLAARELASKLYPQLGLAANPNMETAN